MTMPSTLVLLSVVSSVGEQQREIAHLSLVETWPHLLCWSNNGIIALWFPLKIVGRDPTGGRKSHVKIQRPWSEPCHSLVCQAFFWSAVALLCAQESCMTWREPKGIGFVSQLTYTLLWYCHEQFCRQLPPQYRPLRDELQNRTGKKAKKEQGSRRKWEPWYTVGGDEIMGKFSGVRKRRLNWM